MYKNVTDSVSNRSPAIATDRAVKPQFRYKYRNQSATASIEVNYFGRITVQPRMDGIVHTNLNLAN